MANCGAEQVSASWAQRSRSEDLRRMCQSVFNVWNHHLVMLTWLQERKKKEKERKRNRKDDRMLIRCNLTLLILIICIWCKWTEKAYLNRQKKWQSQGSCRYNTSFHPCPCKADAQWRQHCALRTRMATVWSAIAGHISIWVTICQVNEQ